MENSTEVPQKSKIELPCDEAVPLLGIYPKKLKQYLEEISTHSGSLQQYSQQPRYKQTKWPVIEEQVRKMCPIHKMDYKALQRKEILPFMTTWVNEEDVMLSKTNQSQKEKHSMTPLT